MFLETFYVSKSFIYWLLLKFLDKNSNRNIFKYHILVFLLWKGEQRNIILCLLHYSNDMETNQGY
jgi:hypothetical protein